MLLLNFRQSEHELEVVGCKANQLAQSEFEGGGVVQVLGIERPRGGIESLDLGGGIIRCRCRLAVEVQGGLKVSRAFRA